MAKAIAFITGKLPALSSRTAKATHSDHAKSKSGFVSEPAKARRSTVGATQHAPARTIETLAPKTSRLARKNNDLRAANTDLRNQFLAAKNKEFENAEKAEGGWRQRLVPEAIRLREENKRLVQENTDIERHLQVRNTIKTADEQLSMLFAAMIRRDVGRIKVHCTLLVEAIESVKKGPAFGGLSAIDVYTDRLPLRLKKESTPDLETIGTVAENLAAQTDDPIIKRLYFVVAAELLWRENPTQKNYAVLSMSELSTIRDCSTLLLDQAKHQRLAKHPSDTVRGTHFKLNDLENIASRATKGIAVQTIDNAETTPDAWKKMSAVDIDGVAWAIDLCTKGSSVHAPELRKKLIALDALVTKYRK